MDTKGKILIGIYLILIGAVIYFTYPIIHTRYFNNEEDEKNDVIQNDDEFDLDTDDEDDITDDAENSEPAEATEEDMDSISADDDVLLNIDSEDCDEGCDQFEEEEDRQYCREYCGFTTSEESTSSSDKDCDSLSDLEKDYCYKNKAISEKNFELCKKITDKKLQESCKNRVTEDLINGSEFVE